MALRPFERALLPVPSSIPPPVGQTLRPRVKKASLACTECRKRKSKCIGLPPPCERCRRQNTPCILDEDSDRRRKGAIERRLEALEQDRTLLLRLVDSIREESQEEVRRILQVIRSDCSLDEIRQFLARRSLSCEIEHSQHQSFGNLLFHVPAWPWTTLTDDSNYVSHLLSLYFTWNHPVQKWIDRDLFIRDMQSGDPDSLYCSPFLVNALLAVACCYCDSPESSSLIDICRPGRMQFYNEAKRLLDQEEDRLSLTSFQGRCELYLSTWIMGKHMLGWQYLVEIADCARELIARRNALAAKVDRKAQELLHALDLAIAGSFSAPSVAFPNQQKSSIMPKPTSYIFLPRDHSPTDTWYSYPTVPGAIGAPVPGHSNCVNAELFNLQVILWEISNNPFQSIEQLCATNEEMAFNFHQRLKQWVLQLPDCLTHMSLLDGAPTPAILDMHLRYHCAVISIFEGIKTLNTHPSRADVSNIRLTSARTICSLLEISASRWSVLYMPFIYIHYANVAMTVLLSDLSNSESKRFFVNSYTALHTLADRFPIAKEVLQLILEQARQLQTKLPTEITCLDLQVDELIG
ncbi:hypothetical protein BDV18DRAFT_115137 [Aspergillus unguis]